MLRIIGIITLACLSLLPGACMSIILPKISSELPAANHLVLHTNPQVGDYAVQETVVKGVVNGIATKTTMTMRLEITAIQPGRITVNMMSVVDTLPDQSICYEYVVDEEGNTIEAFFIDKRTGGKTRLKVMQDQTMGYSMQKLVEQVTIDGKDYTVYTYKSDKSKEDVITIIFSLPDIPFLVAEAFTLILAESEVTYQIFTGDWLQTWRKMDMNIIASHITLKEYGNSVISASTH